MAVSCPFLDVPLPVLEGNAQVGTAGRAGVGFSRLTTSSHIRLTSEFLHVKLFVTSETFGIYPSKGQNPCAAFEPCEDYVLKQVSWAG